MRARRLLANGRLALLLAAAFLALAPVGWAAGESGNLTFDRDAALADSRAAVGRLIGDYTFVDTEGRPVRLSNYRGRPLVVSFVYTSCSGVCPLITESLYRAAKAGRQAMGPDSFSLVTIGFDVASDSPDRMRAFAHAHGVDLANWRFLSGRHATVQALAQDLGYDFRPAVQGFDHIAQVSIIGPDGRVYRQVYGDSFDPPILIEPIKDLVFGRFRNDLLSLDGLVRQVRLVCTVYDPATGRYRFNYSIFIGGSVGVLCLGAVAVVLVRGLLQSRRDPLKP